jgi:adenosylcobyric acid synthase
MIQGTMSNAGKSILVTGLCRAFRQDGYRVAPFKSQNMALNSFLTADGLEMGRAQAVQAEACGLEPTVAMNPILLKPCSDTGSQVIVDGRVRGTASAAEYFALRHELAPRIQRAYESLADAFEIVVLEGAGSPAEINLRAGELVNMGMAKLAQAPVLLVGDIDRGGVFAQIVGTLALLPEDERDLIKGTIINKFRGDVNLLRPGLDQLQALTGKPVVGVLPYLDLDIDDEDSLSERLVNHRPRRLGSWTDGLNHQADGVDSRLRRQAAGIGNQANNIESQAGSVNNGFTGQAGRIDDRTDNRYSRPSPPANIDVAVIRLPKVSNFTDFTALDATAGVSVRYVADPAGLGVPDLVVLPGTKSTLADLAWLRRTGLAEAIVALAHSGTPVFGLCGGYQMLGTSISDPDNIEGGGTVPGLNLLPIATTFRAAKRRTRTGGTVAPVGGPLASLTGATVEGYEIHMGVTALARGATPLVRLADDSTEGCWSGTAYGTYLHGFFDAASCRTALLQTLIGETTTVVDYAAYREEQYDRLAAAIREQLDLDFIYRVLEGPTTGPAAAPQSRTAPGLIHLYTGDGKGKTTAALGLALRAVGRGRHVVIAQFLKGRATGELQALAAFDTVTVLRLSRDYGFFTTMDEPTVATVRHEHTALLAEVARLLAANRCDVLILDEVVAAYRHNLIDQPGLLDLLDSKPATVEVVLTGRTAPPELLARADYVTEMRKLRHPFDQGIPARKGIEW